MGISETLRIASIMEKSRQKLLTKRPSMTSMWRRSIPASLNERRSSRRFIRFAQATEASSLTGLAMGENWSLSVEMSQCTISLKNYESFQAQNRKESNDGHPVCQ